ncbi:tyrosine-type recombinase/integrase [Streptomyces griseoincarnatus]
MDDVFSSIREAAGLDDTLDLHCLRHSYITHLIEFGYPERFVQDQVGHRYASTTAIYTNPRELHQTGEKPQVAWSRWEVERVPRVYGLAS